MQLTKSGRSLSQIDSFFQDYDEKALNRSGIPDLYSGSDGWEWVEKNKPQDFELAWVKAMVLMLEEGITEEML